MIYLLEDDDNIRNFVVYALCQTDMKAKGFETSETFWRAMETEIPELVLLDIMLPKEDGLSVLRRLRADPRFASLPVIMLTAKATEYDKVLGLDSGADDYVAKPFGTLELLSRIRALLRRTGKDGGDPEYRAGALYVSPKRHVVRVGKRDVQLTFKEFELLCLLFEHRGRVLDRDTILKKLWGYDFDGENRTVDVHIRTLRAKLGDAAGLIETVRGVGYKIGD